MGGEASLAFGPLGRTAAGEVRGGNDASVLKRLAWLRDVFGPTLGKAIRAAGGIDLKSIQWAQP